jgi:hypothetical protein
MMAAINIMIAAIPKCDKPFVTKKFSIL